MEFRILGPLQVVAAERPVALGGARHERMLAALLLAAGRPVSRTRLVEVAYDDPLDGSRRQLQNRISALRALLAKANDEKVDDGDTGGELIVRHGNGYLLRTRREQVDAFIFDDLTAQARTLAAAGDRVGAARLLRRALALWRGPVLDGLDCGPLRPEIAGLDNARLEAWEDCLDLELATAADTGPFVAELRSLHARHPLRQRLTGLLMTALYRDGHQADALTVYREMANCLADEHGLDPSPDIQDLHRAILRDDLPRPVAAPEPLAGRSCPAQLPAAVRGFTGRVAHINALDAAAEASGRPTAIVITAVCGTAGVGKTALAVHWAHRVRDRFPDGQLYVNLRGFDPSGAATAPEDAIRGFLDALDVPAARIPPGIDAQAALYRSILADRRMLVVLDNARDPGQVRPLLPGSPGSLVVITSRNQLTSLVAVEGAHPLTLDLLTQAEARHLIAHRLGTDRVAAEPDAVNDIVTRCARLPLALAVAAARAATRPGLPLAALAEQLRDTHSRLDTLTAADPASDVRAVFSWSLHTLTPEAARLFRHLGLHPGPEISVAAAASLAAVPPPSAERLLAELTGVLLLNEPVPGRYTIHDLLRAYAADEAERVEPAEDRAAATRRLLDHYLHTARAGDQLLDPLRPQVSPDPPQPGVVLDRLTDNQQALAWFTTEHRVLLAVVDHAVTAGWDTHTWQLACTLTAVHERRGRWHDQVAVQHAAVTAADRLADASVQARAHRNLARAYRVLGRYDDAHIQYRHALELCRRCGDQNGQASSHFGRSILYEKQGRWAESLDECLRALPLFDATGDRTGQANALNVAGWVHALFGNYKQAVSYCQQSLALQQEIGNRPGEAATWDSIGYAYSRLGRHPEALVCYQRSIDLHRNLGSRYYEGEVLTHMGDTHRAADDPDAAKVAYHLALSIFDQLDHPDADEIRARLAQLAADG